MILSDSQDGVVTLRPDETKLFLALALEAHVKPSWTSNYLDGTIVSLALALFGQDGKHVDSTDAEALKHEAHAEYRRG